MIAARQIFLGRGAGAGIPSARAYISEGLIAMWDGMENVGWGQYNANATTWKDLVGDRDLTLSAGACFWRGVITRALYATSYAYLASREDAISDAKTLEACYASFQQGDGGIVLSVGLGQRGLGQYTNTEQQFSLVCRNRSQGMLQPIMYMNVVPITSACTWGNETTAQRLYFNGTEVVQSSSSEPNWGASAWNNIKILGRGEYDTKGYKIGCCFRVYDRTLTEDELAYNHSIDAQRYGIP